MSYLPPFVIIHGRLDFGQRPDGSKRPLYLTATGWGPKRSAAVSFETPEQAKDWISAVERTLPAVIRGSFAKVEKHIYEPKNYGDATSTIDKSILAAHAESAEANDYDPYENGN